MDYNEQGWCSRCSTTKPTINFNTSEYESPSFCADCLETALGIIRHTNKHFFAGKAKDAQTAIQQAENDVKRFKEQSTEEQIVYQDGWMHYQSGNYEYTMRILTSALPPT